MPAFTYECDACDPGYPCVFTIKISDDCFAENGEPNGPTVCPTESGAQVVWEAK